MVAREHSRGAGVTNAAASLIIVQVMRRVTVCRNDAPPK